MRLLTDIKESTCSVCGGKGFITTKEAHDKLFTKEPFKHRNKEVCEEVLDRKAKMKQAI